MFSLLETGSKESIEKVSLRVHKQEEGVLYIIYPRLMFPAWKHLTFSSGSHFTLLFTVLDTLLLLILQNN